MRTNNLATPRSAVKNLIDPDHLADPASLLRAATAARSWPRLVALTRRPGMLGKAARHVLWGVAGGATSRTVAAGHWLVELATTWVARGAGVALDTAARAIRLVSSALGAPRLHPGHATMLGASPPAARPGRQRRGDHLLVDAADAAAVSAEVIAWISAGTFTPPTRGTARAWAPMAGVRINPSTGKGGCACPFHDDHRPSMLLREDPGGRTGVATCLRCESGGRRLTAIWRRLDDGSYEAIRTGAGGGGAIPYVPCYDPPVDGIPEGSISTSDLGPLTRPRPTGPIATPTWRSPVAEHGWVVSTVDRSGRAKHRQRTSRRRDVFAIVRAHDRDAATDATAERALFARHAIADGVIATNAIAPDRYVTANPHHARAWVPRAYRHAGGTSDLWAAAAWAETAVEVVPVDVDGATFPDGGLDAARAVGVALAESLDERIGGISVQRTGPRGLQVLIRLAEARAPDWWRTADARSLCASLGDRVARAAREAGIVGGKVDPSVWHAGARVRLPGLRVAKDGQPWIARCAFQTAWGADPW